MSIDLPPGALAARLDRLPGRWPVWRLVVLLSLGGFFEFYDLFLTAYVSPGLERAGLFQAKAGLLGQPDQAIFAAATFLGLFLGTLAFARVADRYGRRTVFAAALLWYSAATLVMACQTSALGVDAWRLIAGVGVGVELVTIDAYLAEFVPRRLRGRAFALNQAIQFVAVPVVGATAALLVPIAPGGVAGWRWTVALGACGALVAWWLRRRIPESPRWLASQGRHAEAEQAVRALERDCGLPPGEAAIDATAAVPTATSSFLAPPLRSRTVMLAVFNVFQTVGFYGFGNWVPKLIEAGGADVVHSLRYSVAIAVAYPLGPLLCLVIADRYERKWQIVAAAVGTAGFGLLFVTLRAPFALIVCGIAITLSNNLLSYAYHAYQAELFPTAVRARAVGFVYSFSRLSTVFTSLVIGLLLVRYGRAGVFTLIAASMAIVAVAIGGFGPRTRGRSLEELVPTVASAATG